MTAQVHRSLVIEIGECNGTVMVTVSAVVRAGEQTASKVRSAASYRDRSAAFRAVRDFCEAQLLDGAEEQVTRVTEPAATTPSSVADAPF